MLLPHMFISKGVMMKFKLKEKKKYVSFFLTDIMYYTINYLLMNSFLSVFANRIFWYTQVYNIHVIGTSKICDLDHMNVTYICVVRKKHPLLEIQIGILKNFTTFTGKHMCWSLFLIKLQGYSPETLLKRNSNTGVFLWILQNF